MTSGVSTALADDPTTRPTLVARVLVALAVGIASGLVAFIHLRYYERALGFDFTWPWRAARYLLNGQNPYELIRPVGDYPFDAYFKYPLPAALIAVPFAGMSGPMSAAVFGGLSAALLAFALTAETWWRLLILASPPFAVTLFSGQWSTLAMAGALLPMLSWVAVCKPTIGLAVFAYRPNWWAILGSGVLILASFLIQPSWLTDWLRVLRADDLGQTYVAPVQLVGGPILLLALLRWRRPEARYLTAISIAPHSLGFYTAFLAMLVAETRREALLMSVSGAVAWVAFFQWLGDRKYSSLAPIHAGYWIFAFLFIPALLIVLRRPNEGRIPARLERMIASAPSWIRGAPGII